MTGPSPLIRFTAYIYREHMNPDGLLPREREIDASAAWHFAKCAHMALDKIPEQVSYEGSTDQTVLLRNLCNSICQQYGVKIETMMAFMDFVKAEAFRVGLPWNPRFDAWLASGGKAYNEVTREPGALNKS